MFSQRKIFKTCMYFLAAPVHEMGILQQSLAAQHAFVIPDHPTAVGLSYFSPVNPVSDTRG